MVAATKKGRPKTLNRITADTVYNMGGSRTIRTCVNNCYATECIQLNMDEFKSFFVTDEGNFKRVGIAEQIGRIKELGAATDADLIELTRSCINDYNNGASVKEIEKRLRDLRKQLVY